MSGRFWLAVAGAVLLCGLVAYPLPVRGDEPKKPKPPAGSDVFGAETVWQFQLSLTAEEYAAMQPATGGGFPGFGPPMPQPKVEPKPGAVKRETHRGAFGTEFPLAVASLTADGKTIERVGLRYKGNSTYMASARGLKRSFKVDIDKYEDAARFRGLKSLTLNCGIHDATKGREVLAYSMYRAAGVPAPRTAFAEVTLSVPGRYDKEYVGVYTLVEGVDKNFLKLHYKNDSGLLMKPERVRGLDYLGDNWDRYKDTYQPKREATKDEIQRVIAFAKLVNQGSDADFNSEIANYLDVDAFAKYMIATAVTANLDSFFTNGHNYCLYLHPDTKKFHFIPWDLDLSLGNFAFFGSSEQQADLSLTKPYIQNRLADRLMASKAFAERYQALLKDVVARCFNKDKLLAEITAIEKVVKPLLEREQKAASARRENAGGGFGGFGRPVLGLKEFVEKRETSIAAQLAGKSKGYTPQAMAFGPPPAAKPGEVLAPNVQNTLQLTDEQKKALAELQKRVDTELDAILTPDQRAQLKRMRDGAGPPKKP